MDDDFEKIRKIKSALFFLRRKFGYEDSFFSDARLDDHARDLHKKNISLEVIKKACAHFEMRFTSRYGKIFPSVRDFVLFHENHIRRTQFYRPDQWRVEAAKKFGVPLSEIPMDRRDLTKWQKEALNICDHEEGARILRECKMKLTANYGG